MSEPSENMTRDLNYLLNRPRSSSGGAAEAKCTTCAKVEGECRCPEPTFLVFDYPAAARSLMTSLAEFCDDSLPPSEQIAEAGRRARREIESLRARLSFPAVPHAASPAAGPGAPSGEKPSERIACGASHPDPEVEARLVALREAENAPPDTAGCGRRGVWTYMYRCVECGRFFHRGCILKHFAAHTTPRAAPGAGEGRGGEEPDPMEHYEHWSIDPDA